METNTEIKLVSKPKIVHKLQEFGATITKRLEELNIEKLIATEGTMKSLKDLRAELNKELASFEDQRKFIKGEIMNPFNEFETIYKAEISNKYNSAIGILKDKIAVVETKIKDEKKANVKTFYDELCLSEKIDFIPFDKIGLDINLSTSEKAYKEKCSEFINRVIDDLSLIKTTEFEPEILTEYKVSLNASQAITTVRNRKLAEAQEKERLLQVEILSRVARLKSLALIYDEFTDVYVYNDEIFIASMFVKTATKEEFTKKFIEYQEKIKELNRITTPSNPEIQFTAPIHAPVIKTTEETVTASFEVTGTLAQLKALGQYMRTNNITYKNI